MVILPKARSERLAHYFDVSPHSATCMERRCATVKRGYQPLATPTPNRTPSQHRWHSQWAGVAETVPCTLNLTSAKYSEEVGDVRSPSSVALPRPSLDVHSPDPTKAFYQFASQMRFDKKVKGLSLGQGQGLKATSLIEEASQKGTWVSKGRHCPWRACRVLSRCAWSGEFNTECTVSLLASFVTKEMRPI